MNGARYRAMIEDDRDIMIAWGSDGSLRFANPATELILGYPLDAFAHGPRFDLAHPDDRAGFVTAWETVQGTAWTPVPFTTRARTAEGAWVWLEGALRRIPDAGGAPAIVLNARDVSAYKRLEAQLVHLTLHDPLTALPNRLLLMDRLERALQESSERNEMVAVLSIGLDEHLEQITARFGHAARDAVVQGVAGRLASAIRITDTAARIGSDEFILLLPGLREAGEAEVVADRLYEVLEEPVVWQGQQVLVDGHIGIAISLRGENDPDALLRDATIARLESRRTGREPIRLHGAELSAVAGRQLALMSEIRRAVRRDEFRLDYQPIIELSTGRVVQLEALVRWHHPLHGVISPGEFIPDAEATGQIVEIGRWVIGTVCRQLAGWGPDAPAVSVNLSAAQFSDPRLVPEITAHLAEQGVPPSQLAIEITEYVMVHDLRATAATLEQLRQLGVLVAIDDFGTGYSSLRYLNELPVAELKLDRSFVRNLETDPGRAIVSGVTSLAHAVDLIVTAEGIETAEQLAALREIGCDRGQGYYIARPLAGDRLPGPVIAFPEC